MDEELVFNGVNGATGEYGLAPMRSEALAGLIREPGAREPGLVSRRDYGAPLAALVRLLAEGCLEAGERDEAWFERWLDRVAAALARELLEEGAASGAPGEAALKERMRHHTVDKLADVARYLAQGKEQELAALLLRDPDRVGDDAGTLVAKLRQELNRRFNELLKELDAAGAEPGLAHDVALQGAWLERWLARLRLVPVRAWNAANRNSAAMQVRALRPLLGALNGLGAESGSSSRWLGTLRARLAAIQAGGSRPAAWDEVLDALGDGLRARAAEPAAGQTEAGRWQALLAALRAWLEAARQPLVQRGVRPGVDAQNLAEAGWGIVFPYEDPAHPTRAAAIQEALAPLLALRRAQAGGRFKAYEGGQGVRYNDTAASFLARQGVAASDPADPARVPYYLLLVGSPEAIPFHVQYQLDVQYAVGRIDFGDDLDAYGCYARSVVEAERRGGERRGDEARPKATFFGPANPRDPATELSCAHLVEPLAALLRERLPGWRVEAVLREQATRPRLIELMGGGETPQVLFVACHGLEFDQEDASGWAPSQRQETHQGALLCQEWRGPGQGQVPRQAYLAAEDLGEESRMVGTIAFFFACYGAGTPRLDAFYQRAFQETGRTIAAHPFVAALPKAMLSLARGGALAVVGHVERVWSSSFLGARLGARRNEQALVFEIALEQLLKGARVGSAMEYFNSRYAALSTELTAALSASFGRAPVDAYELAEMWTANNDARGYVVIGDPAVRVALTPTPLPPAKTAAAQTPGEGRLLQ
ncbi:MAG: hypothetical protein JXM73_22085 [Anaerolineae bacterium]|nr:hypothetical protein [Anaerolineae bacterium]